MIRFKQAAIPALILSAFSFQASAESTLSPVVVTATRQAMRADELLSDVTVVDRSEIEKSGGASVIDVLGKQPGIQIMQNGGPGTSAEIYLRGTRADEVKILVDGMPINSADTKGSPLRYLPLSDVERIEILRGPASALYGADAVGGVIHIITRRGTPGMHGDAYAGFGSYGTQRLAAGISGGDERLRFRIAGNDFRTDGISAIRNAQKADADHDPYRNMGFNGALDFAITRDNELGLTWARNHGQVFSDSGAGTGTFNSRTDFVTQSWSVVSKNKLNEKWTSSVRYGKSLDDQNYYGSATPSTLITEGSLVSWQNDIQLPLGSGLVLAERNQQQVSPKSRFPSNANVSNNALVLGWNAAMHAHSWQISSRRDEHSSFGDKNTWAGSYGYRVTNDLQLKAAAGTSFKAPTLYQLYATTTGLVPNPALQPEEGRNKEVGLLWDFQGHTFDLVWYRNDLTNLIEYTSSARQYQNISKATLEGATLTWSTTLSDWRTSATLDTLDAKNATTHQPLERRAKEKLSVSANRDWGLWNTGIELISVGRRYSTTTNNVAVLPMGGYTLINLSARYTLAQEWALELSANNITDKQYTTARANSLYDYNTPGANYFVGLRYQMK